MPVDNLSSSGQRGLALSPSGQALLQAFEFRHSAFDSVYYVQNNTDLTLTLEDGAKVLHEGIAMAIRKPSLDSEGVKELVITVDDINRKASQLLQAVQKTFGKIEEIEIVHREYWSNDLTEPIRNPPYVWFLTEAVLESIKVQLKANFLNISNRLAPNVFYTSDRFPGLR